MTPSRLSLALCLASALAVGCDGAQPDLSFSEVFLLTPSDGDTLRVADRWSPGEPRLIWSAQLPVGTGRHAMLVQMSEDPSFTFDADRPQPPNFDRDASRYDRPRSVYAARVPRPLDESWVRTDAPTRLYWRVRAESDGAEPGPWSETGTFVVVAELPSED